MAGASALPFLGAENENIDADVIALCPSSQRGSLSESEFEPPSKASAPRLINRADNL